LDASFAVTYAFTTPVPTGDPNKQYVLTTPAPSPASGFLVSAAVTVTGAYKTQYKITFAQTGMTGDQTGTLVTVNGSPQSTLPYSTFLDAPSAVTYAFTTPVTTSVIGKQYVLTTPAPSPASGFLVSAAVT